MSYMIYVEALFGTCLGDAVQRGLPSFPFIPVAMHSKSNVNQSYFRIASVQELLHFCTLLIADAYQGSTLAIDQ